MRRWFQKSATELGQDLRRLRASSTAQVARFLFLPGLSVGEPVDTALEPIAAAAAAVSAAVVVAAAAAAAAAAVAAAAAAVAAAVVPWQKLYDVLVLQFKK